MKRIIITIALAALACGSSDAQSLKDILKSTADNVLNTVTGAVKTVDLTSGTFTYKGVAVELGSENTLSNVAGKAAAGTVEAKVDAELEKIGIKAGLMSFTFAENNTFKMNLNGRTMSGTYAAGDGSISLMFGKTLKTVTLTGTMAATTDGCKMVFPSQKFLAFIKAVLKVTGQKSDTAATLSKVLQNYDDLQLGFYLSK